MKATEIEEFIESIKNIGAIDTLFNKIGYELPKEQNNLPTLQIIDFDTELGCGENFLVEFRIIGGVGETKIKIKEYSDIIDENILEDKVLNYRIAVFDYSSPFLNKEGRYEVVKTYKLN